MACAVSAYATDPWRVLSITLYNHATTMEFAFSQASAYGVSAVGFVIFPLMKPSLFLAFSALIQNRDQFCVVISIEDDWTDHITKMIKGV